LLIPTVHNDAPSRGKLNNKAIPGIFIKYRVQTKSWIIYLSSQRKLIVSQNVEFLKGGANIERMEIQSEELHQEMKEVEVQKSPNDLIQAPRSIQSRNNEPQALRHLFNLFPDSG
jgi:hypothetical protein